MNTTVRAAASGPKIRLLVTKGENEGTVFETTSFPIIIGRDSQADLSLRKDSNISRIHAEISLKSRRLWISDLGSTNGCIVNDVRVAKKAELSDGAVIILGKTWITIKFLRRTNLKNSHDSNDSTFICNSKLDEAIFVLDQCNSSQIIDVYGDEMGMKLTEALNRLVLPVFKKNKALFVKGTGDGYLATFPTVTMCATAAEEVRDRIARWNKKSSDATEIHIRIGMHYGQSLIEPNGDRHGQAVHMAFRIEGLKYKDIKKSRLNIHPKEFLHEDRIFGSADFVDRLEPKKKAKCRSLGFFRLKGIKGYFQIYNIEK